MRNRLHRIITEYLGQLNTRAIELEDSPARTNQLVELLSLLEREDVSGACPIVCFIVVSFLADTGNQLSMHRMLNVRCADLLTMLLLFYHVAKTAKDTVGLILDGDVRQPADIVKEVLIRGLRETVF